jgi:hemerythrin-like domain-containing protein
VQIVLNKLISDHLYFDTLLTDLAHEIEQLDTNSRRSLESVVSTFNEFRGVIPTHHHALEDRVFDLMKSCNGVADYMIASLERDHICLNRCSQTIERLLRDALVAIDGSLYGEIRCSIEEFIGHYRCHIRMEEETIYPLIEDLTHSVEWRTNVDCMLRMSTNMHINSAASNIQH